MQADSPEKLSNSGRKSLELLAHALILIAENEIESEAGARRNETNPTENAARNAGTWKIQE